MPLANVNPKTTASEIFETAQQLIGDIHTLGLSVLAVGTRPPLDTVRLSQLLGERDEKLRQIGGLDLTVLTDAQRQALWEALEASKSRDLDVEAHLNLGLRNVDAQLHQLHHGRQVMGRYKLQVSGNENTRSDRA